MSRVGSEVGSRACPASQPACITVRFWRRTAAISLPETAKDCASNHSAGQKLRFCRVSRKNFIHRHKCAVRAPAIGNRLHFAKWQCSLGRMQRVIANRLADAWSKICEQGNHPSRERLLNLQSRQFNAGNSSRTFPHWFQHREIMDLAICLENCHIHAGLLQ